MNISMRRLALCLFVAAVACQHDAHAQVWAQAVTSSASTSELKSVNVIKTLMNDTQPSIATYIVANLATEPPDEPDLYYAARVHVSHVRVSANQKVSGGFSNDHAGNKKWRWQWIGSPPDYVEDYTWEYSLRGKASTETIVSIDDDGGYGKLEAYAWVKLEADSVNTGTHESGVEVSCGAEVTAQGFAWSGFGAEFSTEGGGLSLQWEPAGEQLDAYASKAEYVTLSEVARPGNVCFVIVHTSANISVGPYHDSFQYDNDASASAGLDPNYSELALGFPFYSP